MVVPKALLRRTFGMTGFFLGLGSLVVATIFLLPSAGSGNPASPRTKAKNDAIEIANAIRAYRTEYGRLPTREQADVFISGFRGDAESRLLDVLCPPESGPLPELNPRGIVFLEIPKASDGRNGRVDDSGPFRDSWGRPYLIALDGDYDGFFRDPSDSGSPGAKIHQSVLVWSRGDPARGDYANPKRWLKSWE